MFADIRKRFENGALDTFYAVSYCVTASQLSVVNKLILQNSHAPNTLLLCQLISASVITFVMKWYTQTLGSISKDVLTSFIPPVIAFFVLLQTSMQFLNMVSLGTFILIKSSLCIVFAAADYILCGRELPSFRSGLSLLGTLFGAALHAHTSGYMSIPARTRLTETGTVFSPGFIIVIILYAVAAVVEGIVAKLTIQSVPSDNLTRTFVMNSMSIPMSLIMVLYSEERFFQLVDHIDVFTSTIVGVSCAMGLTMGFLTMQVRESFSVTTVAVLGTVNKLLSILTASLFLDSDGLRCDGSLVGILAAIISASFYTQAPLRRRHNQDASAVSYKLIILLSFMYCMVLLSNTRDAISRVSIKQWIAKDCDRILVPSDMNYSSDVVTMTGFYGRLGNRLRAVSHMIDFADKFCCSLFVNGSLLDGWNVKGQHWVFNSTSTTCPSNANRTDSAHMCATTYTGHEWFSGIAGVEEGACSQLILRNYFAVNQTHALGQKCPEKTYLTLHVRAGDVVAGGYNQTSGDYVSASVHTGYGLFPTSYYVATIRDYIQRYHDGNSTSGRDIVVLCENDANPTCDYFRKTAKMFPSANVNVRVGKRLVEDVYYMLCATEVAVSHGTFSFILTTSTRLSLTHRFVHAPRSSTSGEVFYWIADESHRMRYKRDLEVWKNTAYQRYLANTYYDIERSVET